MHVPRTLPLSAAWPLASITCRPGGSKQGPLPAAWLTCRPPACRLYRLQYVEVVQHDRDFYALWGAVLQALQVGAAARPECSRWPAMPSSAGFVQPPLRGCAAAAPQPRAAPVLAAAAARLARQPIPPAPISCRTAWLCGTRRCRRRCLRTPRTCCWSWPHRAS
jgi:hypothetical protein